MEVMEVQRSTLDAIVGAQYGTQQWEGGNVRAQHPRPGITSHQYLTTFPPVGSLRAALVIRRQVCQEESAQGASPGVSRQSCL